MSKVQLIQDPYLNALRKERIPVSIYLVNGIKLQGQIESFDPYVILLRNNISQMVYKHAVSTIVPTRNIRFHDSNHHHHEASPEVGNEAPNSEEASAGKDPLY